MTAAEPEPLTARLRRFPPERYPVQHATTSFHLGAQLLQSGQNGPALTALDDARSGFVRAGMRLELAKTDLMTGIALRGVGRLDDAAQCFTAAADVFEELTQPAEQAAAHYNLGRVQQDAGQIAPAREAFAQAQALFRDAGQPAAAAGAARDHGALLLTEGDTAAALSLLRQALVLAEGAGDQAGAGAAANTLALALLAAAQPQQAADAARRAVAAFPRTVRPAEHAMAKANLALAYEQSDQPARARLAARQVLAVDGIDVPVRAQASALLERLPGEPAADLVTVLEDEPVDQWVALVREELVRALALSDDGCRAVVRGVLAAVLALPDGAYDVAEALLGAVLEQPPRAYARLLAAVEDGCAVSGDEDQARLRSVLSSALARFAIPQWQRAATGLNDAAVAAGRPGSWR